MADRRADKQFQRVLSRPAGDSTLYLLTVWGGNAMTEEKVYTVGELIAKLEGYDEDMPIKVDADGVEVVPLVHKESDRVIL